MVLGQWTTNIAAFDVVTTAINNNVIVGAYAVAMYYGHDGFAASIPYCNNLIPQSGTGNPNYIPMVADYTFYSQTYTIPPATGGAVYEIGDPTNGGANAPQFTFWYDISTNF